MRERERERSEEEDVEVGSERECENQKKEEMGLRCGPVSGELSVFFGPKVVLYCWYRPILRT